MEANNLSTTRNFSFYESLCINSNITAKGPFWNESHKLSNLSYIAMHIITLSLLPRFIHYFLRFLGQPLFVSYLLGGMIMGPSVLGKIDGFSNMFITEDGKLILETLASFGSMMFLFKIGVKTDPSMILKIGNKPIMIGLISSMVSYIFGIMGSFSTRNSEKIDTQQESMLRVLVTSSTTSFPVIACALTDLNILNSDLGRLAISSSMVSDFANVIVNLLNQSYTFYTMGNIKYAKASLVSIIGCLFLLLVVVRPMALWMVKKTPEGLPVSESYITIMLATALVFGFIGDSMGQSPMFGAFLFGLAIPDGPPLGAAIVDKLECLVTGVLMPLHLAITGMKTDIYKIRTQLLLDSEIIIFSCSLGKIVGVVLPGLMNGLPFVDTILLGLILNFKGIVQIAYLNMWMDSGHILIEGNTILVVTILLMTMGMTSAIHHLYDPTKKLLSYKRMSILYSKPNSDFRVLVCIQNQEDVPFVIKFLETSSPIEAKPLAIYLLHLIELVGRASPLLIAHPPQRYTNYENPSKTEQIINAFRLFEQRNKGLIFIQPFSTISPYKSMHNDICTLALNKSSSLIILPFHDVFIHDGITRSTSKHSIKNLIRNVLNHAPCSVGLLIDRNHLAGGGGAPSITSNSYHARRSSSCDQINLGNTSSISRMDPCTYRVVVLFLGGADDREALAYCMLMVENPFVEVSVIRFTSSNVDVMDMTEKILDNEVLDHFRFDIMCKGNSRYKEEMVNDAEELISVIRTLEEDFDLIMVGRRQVTESNLMVGLEEWNEWEELGVFGDFLASPDIRHHGSILVVQQGRN